MITFLSYILVALLLLISGVFLFEVTTKNKEFDLIFNKGNKTAALVLGGKILGLGIVLESALRNSISLLDLFIWGAIAIIAQIILYILIDLFTPKVKIYEAVEQDKVSIGLFILLLSITIGLIVSGALTY